MTNRILVVEDDPALSRALKDNLTLDGFTVECVSDGRRTLEIAEAFAPDLVLLDLMLPGIDGFKLCEIWRESQRIPVIILSARVRQEDKLRGLDLGADDYVTKPFDLEELMARIRAVLRRSQHGVSQLQLGPVTIDLVALRASRGTTPIELTGREYEMLRFLSSRSPRPVSREELLKRVWGYAVTPVNSRAVDHAVARLRRKIEADPHEPQYLHSVYGGGYSLTSGIPTAEAQ